MYSRYTTSGPPPKVATTNSGCLDDSTSFTHHNKLNEMRQIDGSRLFLGMTKIHVRIGNNSEKCHCYWYEGLSTPLE